MSRKAVLWVGLFLAVALTGAALWTRFRPVPVAVIPVQRRDIVVTVPCDGFVRSDPGYNHRVPSPYSRARVRRILVKPGDLVRYGQPLVELDDGGRVEEARLEVRAARKVLAAVMAYERSPRGAARRREAWQRAARHNAERPRRIEEAIAEAWKRKQAALEAREEARASGSPVEIRKAEFRLKMATEHLSICIADRSSRPWWPPAVSPEVTEADNRVQRAEKALRVAIRDTSDMTVRAHTRGRVRSLRAEPGKNVSRGQVLLQVESYDALSVGVPETALRERFPAPTGSSLLNPFRSDPLYRLVWPAYARARYRGTAALVPGADAIVTLRDSPDARIAGTVYGFRGTQFGTREVGIRLKTIPPELRPGMPVQVEIVSDRYRDALVLPRLTVQGTGRNASVLVVRGGRVVRQPVKLAGSAGLNVIVAEGLREGDLVAKSPDTLTVGRRARPRRLPV